VEFDSAPIYGAPPPSETRGDWTFEVTNLFGFRRIFVDVSSPDWTIKSITQHGIDVTDTPVDLRTSDIEDVEVVLTPRVSTVAGRVRDGQGPLSDYAVVIFPSNPTLWTDRSRFVVLARPSQLGGFEARGLPPEDYLAVALPNVVGREWTDPDFLQQLRSHATSFVLLDGEAKTMDLILEKHP
jgi:hypothetical protein